MKAFKPGRMDKTSRLHSVSHFIENGMVYIPESTINPGKVRDWAQDFVDQVCSFPAAQHDEYVDCLSSCLITLSNMSFLRLEEMAEDIDEPDGSDPYASANRVNPYSQWYRLSSWHMILCLMPMSSTSFGITVMPLKTAKGKKAKSVPKSKSKPLKEKRKK